MSSSEASYTRNFNEDVLPLEHLRIGAMRGNGENGLPGYTGLSISGGGIRSASFATGVLQGLVANDLLRKIDYMSTVSGGGYIGCSLTWYLTQGIPDPAGTGTIPAGTTAADFPYGSGKTIGYCTDTQQSALDHIRDHGKYLTPGSGLNLTSAISVVARSMFISLFAYLLLICLVMVPLRWLHLFQDYALSELPNASPEIAWLQLSINPFLWCAIFLLGIMAILTITFSVRTAAPALNPQAQYAGLNMAQRLGGYGIMTFFILLVIGSFPYCHYLIGSIWGRLTTAGLSTFIGTVLSAYELSKKTASPNSNTLRIIPGAILLIYGLLQAGYLLSAYINNWIMLFGLAVVALIVNGVVNINHVGIHRMYRDRLMETFMPDNTTLIKGSSGLATAADKALLEDFCKESSPLPYHLINTNIILTDSEKSKYRGRGGHSFLLSPLYCGSDATGWRHTSQYMKGGWMNLVSQGMTLASAMAISGAAANPHSGIAGRGLTRNPLISTVMTLLNLRLGYWAVNPDHESMKMFPPNFLIPGLRSGIFGRGLHEAADEIELTDGGHFENLGLYELLRRRLRLIIVSDGSADPDYKFGDLANALERARVDFGVETNFWPEYNISEIIPGSKKTGSESQRIPHALRPFAVSDIFYNNGPGLPPDQGLLIYLKSTLVKGLSEDIYGYYTANQKFPNEPTSDQFFDEAQFEAYRELGYQLSLQMAKVIIAKKWL